MHPDAINYCLWDCSGSDTNLPQEELCKNVIQMSTNALHQPRTSEKGNRPKHLPTKWIPMQLYQKVSDHSTHYSTTNRSYEKDNTGIHQKHLRNNQLTITTTQHQHSTKPIKALQNILSKSEDPVVQEKKHRLSITYSIRTVTATM